MFNPHLSELMVTARQADIRRAAANHRAAGRPGRGDGAHRVRRLFAPRHRRVVLSVLPG